MIPEEITKANLALANEIDKLKGQIATHERLLLLCVDMINNFEHFLPRVIADFKLEFERIRGEEEGSHQVSSELDKFQSPENYYEQE